MSSIFSSSTPASSSLGYYNPAFKIKIVNPNDDLQQPASHPRGNSNNDRLSNFDVGEMINVEIGEKNISGRVERIEKNKDGENIFVIILSDDGKRYKVDASRIISSYQSYTDPEPALFMRNASAPAVFSESRMQNFSEFIAAR